MKLTLSLAALACILSATSIAGGQDAAVTLETPMPPPEWALLERELLRANAAACREFHEKYFDERGFLLCVERWGGDDGPDDAMECCNDWPLLHALGGDGDVLARYKRSWEGHLRQFTLARTTEVPFARDGMYYKEFPVTFDWLHNGEGLTVFNLQGLSDPRDDALLRRARRFAGFYMNEEPGAENYDAEHKIIKSLFNGSRGPLLRPATALDWAGDPIEVKGRFHPGHGEESYQQMLAHFEEYNDIVGDHPLNLLATSLALNAYLLTGEEKYKAWLLDYVGAWRERMLENGNVIPTKIGLDGKIGGEAGKWYGGVYGWAFSVTVPQDGGTAHRNIHHKGFTGFANAYLLTGDDRWLEPWRRQIEAVNGHARRIDGRTMYPRMHGDEGWYQFTPLPYDYNAVEIAWLSMRPEDRRRLKELQGLASPDASPAGYRDGDTHERHLAWLDFLGGEDADFPERELRRDFARIRRRVEEMRADTSTPDTRLSDDPMGLNPCSVGSLVHLMLGGLHPGRQGSVLHCAVRYFDPVNRRAGLPEDTAALVDRLSDDEVALTLANVSQTESRELVLQGGAYAEHRIDSIRTSDGEMPVDAPSVSVRLAPGCGGRITLRVQRYANQPTMAFPWDRIRRKPAQ